MTRAVIVLLLLAVCFLAGVVYGNNGGEEDNPIVPTNVTESDERAIEKEVQSAPDSQHEVLTTQPEMPAPATEKTASVLEAGITSFFEAVVTILHQIAELFF
ncbi:MULTISPECIES: hypothetical protein [Virgibacillus]|uniref:Uncharacterized protein n=1 Tax=Virgibacillus pantothenticus TaxID=1473 RepID=A0A0L0QQS5_VIRPA|nr:MULTISPECIES: hypothetical protein [Virgibacillus]API90588.1 hypothetical protein BKP57_01165 [Virgibacillus sp. 6R]KNE20543.1 hypothetical protein AFK71_19495 [Virgibacillus pantothenticus]MBS7429703.1 hypothetical protein [Virgibacillus sp. 19R1-5]MBU8565578.1 hypothetical protein [Virgibacillus pantothenticus]MBU8599876.1 hypothetical protein [Virgibacillus pantothenticus]